MLINAGSLTTTSLGGDEVQTTLSVKPNAVFYAALASVNTSFDFASTAFACHYLSGTMASIPAPNAFLLLGSGLLAVT